MNTKNITITTESGATFAFTVKVLRYWTEEETVKREWGGSFTFTRAKFDLEITVPDRPTPPFHQFRTEYSAGSGCIPQIKPVYPGCGIPPLKQRGDESVARRQGYYKEWARAFAADVALYNPGESVIASLCLDAGTVEYSPTFAQWAEDLGETCIPVSEITDRMRAYTQCQETLQWLRWAVQTPYEGHSTRLPLLMEWANEQ